jgi:Uma2 family endonuclease
MAGASANHIDITGNIFYLLYSALQNRPCSVSQSDMRVKAITQNYFYPDVTVACDKREFVEDDPVAILLNPIVIVEVLPPSTESHDRSTKFFEYQQIPSLQDYLLVAQDTTRLELFSRGENKVWLHSMVNVLAESLLIPSIDVALALSDVYTSVTFDKTP